MSLQLIWGSSGSGKSHWLYSAMIREAREHPEKRYMIIVPEQFTMQTQRELVRLHPAGGILNIDILSFQRLAFRVFEETGASQKPVLTETGKNLLLRRVAAQERSRLDILGSRLEKPGYISQMKSILSELTQYEISEGELEEMIRISEKKPQLQYKLKDILTLYRGFSEYKRDRFLTAEELLDVFCEAAEDSRLLKGSVLAFDGFTGFTPVQQNALKKLLTLCSKIQITVTMDPAEQPVGRIFDHELFYLSKKTIQTLFRLAEETGTQLLEPVVLTQGHRFRSGGELEFLERHLFRYGKQKRLFRTSEKQENGISLHVSGTPMEEVEFAARTIITLVREQGFRYREIAVMAGDLPSYGNYVKKVFEEQGIPCFVDQTVQVLLNPCLEFIRGAFGLLEFNFSYESVFRYLRTGFAGISREETDRLENYVRALGIRGKYQWEQSWTRETASMVPGEAAVCEEYRKRIMESLAPWLEISGTGKAPLRRYAEALYELLVSCKIQQQLKEQEQEFERKGQREKVNEYSQIYRIILEILDEAVELLEEEEISRKEFLEILEAGFGEARVGLIPPGIDQVHVGDMERTRLNQIRVLLFLGLNDGWIPARESKGGIVSDMEREFLHESGIELSPTARENGYVQRFYLYLGLTKPSERLYLSFCRSSSDGGAMRPSYLVAVIRRLFPYLEIRDENVKKDPLDQITSLKTGLPYLAENLRLLREKGGEALRKRTGKLLQLYQEDEGFGKQAEALVDAAFLVLGQEKIDSLTAKALYGEVLENSVTRLEQFASCAFAHFAAYGLQLKEREEYKVRSVDIGNIFHKALELFARKLENSPYNWFTLPEEDRKKLTEDSVEEAVETYGSQVFFDTERNRYGIQRIKRILNRSVWALHRQIQAGRFVPGGFEVSFSSARDLKSVNIALSETERMRLKGRIDRIDVCQEEDQVYVKVVDYKSGNTSFDLVALYYGLQLQLVVYLNAAMELEQRLHPEKEIVPAGIFYFRLQDPILEGTQEMTPEEINREILKKLRPSGLVNQDPAVVERMDGAFEKNSLVIPVGKKKDGSWTAASKVAKREQLEALSCFVQEKLQHLGQKILEGWVAPDPYERKQECSCTYCQFSGLCGFDRKLPGTGFRKISELTEGEIWERLSSREKE